MSYCRDMIATYNAVPKSGLKLWLDATYITGLSDGTAITTWNDRSGNGYNAAQSDSAKKPTYKVNILNGKPVVRFDGGDELALSSGFDMLKNVGGFTTIAVGKFGNPELNETFVKIGSGAGTSRAMLIKAGTKLTVAGRRLDAESPIKNLESNNVVSLVYHKIYTGIIDFANSNAYLYQNNVADGVNTNFSTDGNTENTNSTFIGIGGAGSEFLSGDIAELVVYNRTLSNNEITQINKYLSVKWGIAV